jgi:predicted nucleic acid-binding protein
VLDPLDQWHEAAKAATSAMGDLAIVTTDEVLLEVLNTFCSRGSRFRRMAVDLVHRLRRNPTVQVLEQSRTTFDAGVIAYDRRDDKGYSLVDCVSMNTMRSLGIQSVLTHDRHFTQEGFEVLIS